MDNCFRVQKQSLKPLKKIFTVFSAVNYLSLSIFKAVCGGWKYFVPTLSSPSNQVAKQPGCPTTSLPNTSNFKRNLGKIALQG